MYDPESKIDEEMKLPELLMDWNFTTLSAETGLIIYVTFFPPNKFSKIMAIFVTIFGLIGARMHMVKVVTWS